MSDVSAFTTIGFFVFLCTLVGDTADDHPVVMAFTWGIGKFGLSPGQNWDGQRLGPELQSHWKITLETGIQWQQMNNFSVSASLRVKLKGEELFFKNIPFEFWGNISGLSGLQVLKSIVFLTVITLKTFPQINISNLLQSVSIPVIKISTGIKIPIWVIIW